MSERISLAMGGAVTVALGDTPGDPVTVPEGATRNSAMLRPRRTGGMACNSAERATQLATATLGISSVTLAYRKQLLKPGAGIKAVTE